MKKTRDERDTKRKIRKVICEIVKQTIALVYMFKIIDTTSIPYLREKQADTLRAKYCQSKNAYASIKAHGRS